MLILVLLSLFFQPTTQPPIQRDRLRATLEELSKFGRNPEGGVSRIAFSGADRAGRQYVIGLMRDAGLTVRVDNAANIIGRTFLRIGEAMVDRTPVVRGLYKSFKQIFETVFSQGGDQFRRVGLVEFPMKGAWSVVFISSEPARAVADALPEQPMTSVFLPCTPNPTTGFYFFLPARDIIEVALSPDAAAKLIMSCGVIQPDALPLVASSLETTKEPKPIEEDAA